MKQYKITTGFTLTWERNLWRAIEDVRRERGEPMWDLCLKANIAKTQYKRILDGETSATITTLINILNALDIDLTLKPKEDE